MNKAFKGLYKGKKVLVTGHTGFKGSWLCIWLTELGAKVIGYSLEPPTEPNLFEAINLEDKITHIIGDVRDEGHLLSVFEKYQPIFVFHLAAQPLVKFSYKEPKLTFETNVMGTINVFEACRQTESVRAIVNITSDKCYENREWVWGYRESDPMGGYDPYSASKGCAEIVTSAYRSSFFNLNEYGKSHNILLASARAGNVIGGGDWGEDRLIPDIVKAVSRNEKVIIRNPNSTRPWQHVFEPLSGYLMLGQKLLEGEKEFAEGWNFGPDDESNISVKSVVENIKQSWNKIEYEIREDANNPHEAGLLKLDCSKAHLRLNWKPVWDIKKALERTVGWYKEFYENGKINSLHNLKEYVEDARKNGLRWSK